MKTKILLTALSAICLLSANCAMFGGSGEKDMNSIFADMETAIRTGDEDSFKKHWLPEAYTKNTVGRNGLEGASLFRQGARKKWFPKPDFSKSEKIGGVTIVPTNLWSWEKERSVDEIFFAVNTDGEPKILGGGEDLQEVRKLAERADKGEPLIISE